MMIWKKPYPDPLGVPLEALEAMLEPTTLLTSREENVLIVRDEQYTTRVSVVPPTVSETADLPISAVVQIKTKLPSELEQLLSSPELLSIVNSRTAIGAITEEDKEFFIGSRLTVYEGEDVWELHFPLLLFLLCDGANAIMGATRRLFSEEEPQKGVSDWTEEDMNFVGSQLSRICYCNAGDLGLTAEFGLKAGAASALAGDKNTALWRLFADVPHPELGGGLFCLLEMPHQIEDEAKLDFLINQLNLMEMNPNDLPPHYGAWCRGKTFNNPAYVTFLPNYLHVKNGIALNFSHWASFRAQVADAMLASHDITL